MEDCWACNGTGQRRELPNAPGPSEEADCNQRLALPSSGELLGKWYESSAYGDHVPKELPKLIVEFDDKHGMEIFDEARAWELISESMPDDPWSKLFECIFAEGAQFAMQTLESMDLLRESVTVKPDPSYKCSECDYWGPSVENVLRHKTRSH